MTLVWLGRRSVLCVSIVSGVSRPPRLSIAIGRYPACWSPPSGGPIRCLPLFIFGISNTKLTSFVTSNCMQYWFYFPLLRILLSYLGFFPLYFSSL